MAKATYKYRDIKAALEKVEKNLDSIKKRPKKKTVKVKRIKELDEFREYMKTVRKNKKISMTKLAEFTGVSRQSLTKFEKGETDMKFQNILAIVQFLGLKLYVNRE